jgi:hypothetical protein
MALLDAMTLVWTGKVIGEEVTFTGPIGAVTGQTEFYLPMLHALREAPTTFGQLRALPGVRDRQPAEFVQAVILLIGGGFAHPAWPHGGEPATRESARRLNAAIVDRLRVGVDLARLVAPLIGSGFAIEVMEGLLIGQLLGGGSAEPEALIDGLSRDLAQSGRTLRRDGQVLTDPVEARALLGNAVRGLLDRRLAWLRAMGVVD